MNRAERRAAGRQARRGRIPILDAPRAEHRRLLDESRTEREAARQVAERWPDDAAAQNTLGVALVGPGVDAANARAGADIGAGWAEAQDHFRRAMALAPGWADPRGNLAAVLGLLGRVDEADALHRCALDLAPGDATMHAAYGITLRWRGDLDAAERHLRRALTLEPGRADATSTLVNTLLLRGDYAGAWRVYDRAGPTRRRPARSALWDGRDLGGRPIFLYANDGLGDALMLVRYAPLVAARGGDIVVGCPSTLVGLLGRVDGVAEAIDVDEDPVPRLGTHLPLSLLPYAFRTTPATIPAAVPYLTADPAHAARWAAWLAGLGRDLTVGIVWGGSRGNPHNWVRSMPLAALAPLAGVPGVRLFALQQGPPLAELGTAPPEVRAAVTRLDGAIGSYDDTAAIVAGLDLVVTIDSSPAHLAGALARPTWVLLPATCDWFWGLEGERTPWYPTARLFRQERLGDWSVPVARVAAELTILATKRRYGALPLCGLRGVDEAGALTTWKPETAGAARS